MKAVTYLSKFGFKSIKTSGLLSSEASQISDYLKWSSWQGNSFCKWSRSSQIWNHELSLQILNVCHLPAVDAGFSWLSCHLTSCGDPYVCSFYTSCNPCKFSFQQLRWTIVLDFFNRWTKIIWSHCSDICIKVYKLLPNYWIFMSLNYFCLKLKFKFKNPHFNLRAEFLKTLKNLKLRQKRKVF